MQSYVITIPPLWGRGEGGGASKGIYDFDAMRNKLQNMLCGLGLILQRLLVKSFSYVTSMMKIHKIPLNQAKDIIFLEVFYTDWVKFFSFIAATNLNEFARGCKIFYPKNMLQYFLSFILLFSRTNPCHHGRTFWWQCSESCHVQYGEKHPYFTTNKYKETQCYFTE